MRGRRLLIGRNGVNVRLATIDDIKQLADIRMLQQHEDWGSDCVYRDNDFYNRTVHALDDFTRWHDGVQPSKGVIFVAEANGAIIATCGLQRINMLPQYNDDGKYGFIFNVFTVEEYRRQGVQSLLLKEVLVYAKEIGITEIKLETDSEIAIELYKKHGFKRDELFMSKQLG